MRATTRKSDAGNAGSECSNQRISGIITTNPEMLSLLKTIEAIRDSRQPVLITGETGTGKELFARAIHTLSMVKGPFVMVNVAGLDDNIFSDTLFGHLRGAFTGADRPRQGMIEKASGGTLFLDEIGDLSHHSQVKLLRLLQDGDYLPLGSDDHKQSNARIITATNRDLWEAQRSDRFRADLNYRLRTHHVNIPALRERLEDIEPLLQHFLEQASIKLNKNIPTPPKELQPLLMTYSFPGNVRELQGMVFDAVSRHQQKVLSLRTFHEHIARNNTNTAKVASLAASRDAIPQFLFNMKKFPTIQEATSILVAEAMKQAGNNQAIASRMLGITRQALGKRLKKMSEPQLKFDKPLIF